MNTIRQIICSLLDQPSILSVKKDAPVPFLKSTKIDGKLSRNVIGKEKSVKENGFVRDFLWDLLDCDTLFPPSPPPSYCINDADCNAEGGERCKEGTCVDDPAHCANSGCPDNYTCNVETGTCDFAPECTTHADCDGINTGELCLNRQCTVPEFCLDGLGPTIGCAAGWTCIGGECVKVDCSIIQPSNSAVCCETPVAFEANKTRCCSYNPAYPGCP